MSGRILVLWFLALWEGVWVGDSRVGSTTGDLWAPDWVIEKNSKFLLIEEKWLVPGTQNDHSLGLTGRVLQCIAGQCRFSTRRYQKLRKGIEIVFL